jgi:hypothetical protein
MSSDSETVECARHGTQQRTWVCQHVVQGLFDRTRVGFFWTADDPQNQRPDAWCAACEDRVSLTNGDWVGEAGEHLGAQILCGACYDLAKGFHMGEAELPQE